MGLIAMQPGPVRVAIYARISPTPESKAGENFSIKSQLHEGREKALRDYGCSDPAEYIDKNYSGGTLDRPDLDRLRDHVALKMYDVIIAYSPDRWTREPSDKLILNREIAKGGARIEYCTVKYDDTAEGELSEGVQDVVNRYEKRKFKERSRRGRRTKSLAGLPHACKPPDGYIYEGHTFGKRGEYVKVVERAKIINLIYRKTAQGMTNSEVAHWLNEEGVETYSTWRRKQGYTVRKEGKRWARNTVAQVLAKKKTAYYGEITQNGEIIKVPVIVSRELWDAAHEALARHKVGRVGREPRQYLLSGKIWCARCKHRCGSFPRRVNEGGYRCNHIDHTDRKVRFCHAPEISKRVIEPAVWNALWDAVCDPALLWQLVEAYHVRMAGPAAKKDPGMVHIDKAKRKVALAEQILKDPDKPISYDQAKRDLAKANRELADAQIAAGATVIEMPLRKDVVAASAAFRAMRTELESFASRREALKLLVDKIFYADGKCEIHANLPSADSRNCHSRIRGNGNLSNPIPFVINIEVATRPSKYKRQAA